MKLTRFGFNLLVLIWLAPTVLIDIYGNTVSTGSAAKFYYFAAMFHGLLALYAASQLFRQNTMGEEEARRAKADPRNSVVEIGSLSSAEYVYCAFLVAVGLVSWWLDFQVNSETTGMVSILALIWSFLDLIVAVIAGIQFWHLKSGAIVEVTHRVATR